MIVDCNIANNVAYQGGGMYCVDSDGHRSSSTLFTRNRAFQSVLDPNFLARPELSARRHQRPRAAASAASIRRCEIRDSVFTDNRATTSGGGVYFGGSDQDVERRAACCTTA